MKTNKKTPFTVSVFILFLFSCIFCTTTFSRPYVITGFKKSNDFFLDANKNFRWDYGETMFSIGGWFSAKNELGVTEQWYYGSPWSPGGGFNPNNGGGPPWVWAKSGG